MNAGFIGAMAAFIAVPIAFRCFGKIFPAQPSGGSTTSLEELRAKYKKWEQGFAFAILALAACFGVGIWAMLRVFAGCYASSMAPAEVSFTQMPIYWALPALFLGIVCAGLTLQGLAPRLMRGEYSYAEYNAYQELRFKFDQTKVASCLYNAVFIGCAVFVFLGLDCYVLVRGDTLIINRYLSLGESHYKMSEIAQIRTAAALTAPNGNVVPRREYVVRFANGDTWTTNSMLSDPTPAQMREFMELLSKRSGVGIEEIEVLLRKDLQYPL